MVQKLLQILMKTVGLSKLVLMVWGVVYKALKEQTKKTENTVDDEVLNILNTVITAVCGELASKK